jgi:hypothetical protein
VSPQLWGIDRFPCSRASLLDVFREGDFDYPYRLKQLDRVSRYMAAWESDLFAGPRATAGCKQSAFLDPLRFGVYWQVGAGFSFSTAFRPPILNVANACNSKSHALIECWVKGGLCTKAQMCPRECYIFRILARNSLFWASGLCCHNKLRCASDVRASTTPETPSRRTGPPSPRRSGRLPST